MVTFMKISNAIASKWMAKDHNDDKSKLHQVMAWRRQARSHYLSQCWPIPVSPYGVTRPQWVMAIVGLERSALPPMKPNNTISKYFLFRKYSWNYTLWWRHNGHDDVSNHQPHHCLPNGLFGRRSKKNVKAPRHWPLCGEFTGDRWIPRTNGQ